MAQTVDLEQLNIIKTALSDYNGFTSGEKEYCSQNLSEWISNDNGLNYMIDKLAEKSLDARPFLEKIGLLSN